MVSETLHGHLRATVQLLRETADALLRERPVGTLCWRQLQDSHVECGNTPVVALGQTVRLLRENAGELSVLRFTSERPRRVRESRLSWCECEPTPLSGGSGPRSSCGGNPRAAAASRESRLSWRRGSSLTLLRGNEIEHRAQRQLCCLPRT